MLANPHLLKFPQPLKIVSATSKTLCIQNTSLWGVFRFQAVEGTGRKIFLQTKDSCQKNIELDQPGQKKKKNANISVGKEEEKLPIHVFSM